MNDTLIIPDSSSTVNLISERIEDLTHDLALFFAENRRDAGVCALRDDFTAIRDACVDDLAVLAVTMVIHAKCFGNTQIVYAQKARA